MGVLVNSNISLNNSDLYFTWWYLLKGWLVDLGFNILTTAKVIWRRDLSL